MVSSLLVLLFTGCAADSAAPNLRSSAPAARRSAPEDAVALADVEDTLVIAHRYCDLSAECCVNTQLTRPAQYWSSCLARGDRFGVPTYTEPTVGDVEGHCATLIYDCAEDEGYFVDPFFATDRCVEDCLSSDRFYDWPDCDVAAP